MLTAIDDFLNKYTMYRGVLYGLAALIAIAEVLSVAGAISISSTGLIISVLVLSVACYAANKAFSVLLQAPSNTESWLISALILVCILPPITTPIRALYVALAGIVAMASKYLITYRGTHIFNPAAFGAFVMSIVGLLPAIWWIATPWLTPFTLLLALFVLRKVRRFQLFFAFAVSAICMLLLVSMLSDGSTVNDILWSALVSWPIIFFGSIMLTEPITLPGPKDLQFMLAVILGLLFTSQLHIGILGTTPQAVLLLGNILTAVLASKYGAMLGLKKIQELAPDTYEAVFERPKNMTFRAGQYAEFTLRHPSTDSRGNRRTFSLASAPHETEVRVAFKRNKQGSSFKQALLDMKPSQQLRMANIAGNFTLPADHQQPLLFIAGGIGITPFRSMAVSLTVKRPIILIYMANADQDFVYKADFRAAAKFGLEAHYLTGRLSIDELQQLVPDLSRRKIYLSGPNTMVRSYQKTLGKLGVLRSSIKTDYFTGY